MSAWGEALYRCAERYHGTYRGSADGDDGSMPSETLELMYNGTRMLVAPLASKNAKSDTYRLSAKVQISFELNHRYRLSVRKLSFAGKLCDRLFGAGSDTVSSGNKRCDGALRIRSNHEAFTLLVFSDKNLRKQLMKNRFLTASVAPVGEDAHLHTLSVESDISLSQKHMTQDEVLDTMILTAFKLFRALTAVSFPEDFPKSEDSSKNDGTNKGEKKDKQDKKETAGKKSDV